MFWSLSVLILWSSTRWTDAVRELGASCTCTQSRNHHDDDVDRDQTTDTTRNGDSYAMLYNLEFTEKKYLSKYLLAEKQVVSKGKPMLRDARELATTRRVHA